MDNSFKLILTGIIVCMVLIGLKVTVFSTLFETDEIIPGVTDDEIFMEIHFNSTLGQYILSDSFVDEISGTNIHSKSEIYVTNETTGEEVYARCCDSLLGIGYDEDYTRIYEQEGKYSGVYKNETHKIVFHIFEGSDVEDYTGYYLVLTVYRGKT